MQQYVRHFKIELIIYKLSFKCDKVIAFSTATCRFDDRVFQLVQQREIKNNIAYFYEAIKIPLVTIEIDKYQEKYLKRVINIQFQYGSQAVFQKLGQIEVDLADILNTKKTRIPVDIPLKKCYDKNAFAKISADFDIIHDKRQINLTNQAKKPILNEQLRNIFISGIQPFQQQQKNSQKNNWVESNKNQQQIKIGGKAHSSNREQLQDLQSKVLVLQNQNKKLIEKLRFTQDEIKSYKLANEKFLESSTIMMDERSTLLKKIKQLEQQNNFYQDKISSVNITRQAFMNMEAKVAQLVNINEKLRNDLQNNQIILDDTTRAKQKLIEVYQFLLQQKKKIAAQANELKIEVEQLREDKQLMRTTIINLTKKDQARQKHLIEERQKYSQKMKEIQEEKSNSLLQIETNARLQLQAKESFYRESLKKNQERLKQHNQCNNSREKDLCDKIISLKEKIRVLQENNESIKLENKQLTSKTHNLQNQTTLNNSKLVEYKQNQLQLLGQIQSLKTTLKIKQRQINVLKQHNQNLINKLQSLKVQIQYTNQTICQNNRKIASLQNQIDFVRKQLDLNERNNKVQQVRRERQIERLLKENRILNFQLIKAQSQLTILNDDLKQQMNRIGAKKETVVMLQSQKQKATKEIARLQYIRIQLQTENKRLKMNVFNLQQKLQQLQHKDKNLSYSMVEPKNKIMLPGKNKKADITKYNLSNKNDYEFQDEAKYTMNSQRKKY